ncbi:hypothetical protein LOK49_LG01G02431 [Camellia lanceoleosa]|uniref:Uncharacterized protein n=1 Tax=Camellia lanceoleosa TaxID=1840588 RepID=A0ACC0IS87_9ERIC|nr:hypothetical protein LOK49_LG01G02431 [Camellia lanceoleosa]
MVMKSRKILIKIDGGDDEVVMSSTAKAREHKKLRVCVDSAMELMNEVDALKLEEKKSENSFFFFQSPTCT